MTCIPGVGGGGRRSQLTEPESQNTGTEVKKPLGGSRQLPTSSPGDTNAQAVYLSALTTPHPSPSLTLPVSCSLLQGSQDLFLASE